MAEQSRPRGAFVVNVESLTGGTFSVDCGFQNPTTEDLMHAIEASKNCPLTKQRLSYNGEKLEIGRLLADQGIAPNAIINFIWDFRCNDCVCDFLGACCIGTGAAQYEAAEKLLLADRGALLQAKLDSLALLLPMCSDQQAMKQWSPPQEDLLL